MRRLSYNTRFSKALQALLISPGALLIADLVLASPISYCCVAILTLGYLHVVLLTYGLGQVRPALGNSDREREALFARGGCRQLTASSP